MSEKVLPSGSYLLCSGEKRFHRKQDVGGRRDSVSLADQNTWLKRRVNLARLIAKKPHCRLWGVCYNTYNELVTVRPKAHQGLLSKNSEQMELCVIYIFFNNFH